MSDCDERNELVGRARDGDTFCLCRVSSWLPRASILQFIAQSSKGRCRRRIFQQPHVKVSAELLGVNPRLCCGTDDAIRDLDSQVVCCLWYGILFLRRETKNFSPLAQGSTTVDSSEHPVLRIYVRFFHRRETFEEICILHVCKELLLSCRPLCGVSTLCVVPAPLGTQLLQIDCVLISSVPRTFLCSVTTGVRILEISELRDVG